MRIRYLPVLIGVFLTSICSGQVLTFTISGQRHDFRTVPDVPFIESWTDHTFGVKTYQLTYMYHLKNNFNFGIGVGYERSITPTSLNPEIFGLNRLTTFDRYIKYLIFIPIEYNLPLKKGFNIGLQMLPGFGTYKSFASTRDLDLANFKYYQNGFYFNDCEFVPFVEYRYKKVSLRLGGRIFHLKKVDDAIFFKEYFDKVKTQVETHVYTKNVDIYNPFKLFFTFGYRFQCPSDK
ncbi:MAG: hypothetical protein IPN49_13905 [Saprospiraceae bacterium]|nr:hypothetical protein [Saprospiraceae bacterium]MBK6566758.1 hypothetical protein [Saprospiraceae bacterium]MBK8081756.1 hypothetical protein [Saprospiraceae bacterium]MBK8371228.1 hypothetical protein [Saprospiraceae bacterium]MBK8820117.1 hypothetical protein [Saprospiraceae bacterium]